MATTANKCVWSRQMSRIHAEITDLEHSVVDDSIAYYQAWREYEDVRESSPGNIRDIWRKLKLYDWVWKASVAALLVKRAVLVYLEGGEADDPDPTF